MTEVWFYHLEQTTLEAVLPDLLEKTLARGWRALVRAGSEERVAALDAHLWTYREDAFLPHGTAALGQESEQPIFLTAGLTRPNGAEILFLVDGAPAPELTPSGESAEGLARIVVVFDGRDEAARGAARAQWAAAKARGLPVSYWQQDGRSWTRKG